MNITELKNGINRTLDDTCQKNITRKTLAVYGRRDWQAIKSALTLWRDEGFLRIIKDPEVALDDETCVEMLSYIDRTGPWPNWP